MNLAADKWSLCFKGCIDFLFQQVVKHVEVPLDVELFQAISQVQKTLSDVMASPSGVVADKDNFAILMAINKELSDILNNHLKCMLQKLWMIWHLNLSCNGNWNDLCYIKPGGHEGNLNLGKNEKEWKSIILKF